jgi:NADH-quinone oxidoreductase subunit E
MMQEETRRAVDVVVIDDEESIREGCRQALESEGYRALSAKDGRQGIRLVEQVQPRLVLLDLRMPDLGGIDVLGRLPAIDPRIVPIVITGYGTVDSAVASMKLGAFDFIAKPFDMTQLLEVVTRGMNAYAARDVRPEPLRAEPRLEPRLAPQPPAFDETDVLLHGIEVLAQYQSLGLRGQSLSDKLLALEAEASHHARQLGRIREKEKSISGLLADLRLVDEVVARHAFKKSALIQILLDIQVAKRWLPQHVISWVARRLNVPLARIYSIATFYEAFSLVPQGAHTVQVCTGTACHVRKSPELLAKVSSALGIRPGETDAKGQFTLKTVNCLGCCALAPVMKVDESTYGRPSTKALGTLFKSHEGSEDEPCQS